MPPHSSQDPSADPPRPGTEGDALRDASRGERLQRVLADAGVASRRVCEQMIEGGRVSVNGQVVRTLPAWVDPSRDAIRVDGALLPKPEPHLYIMLNKPARMLATPPEGADDARRSALDLVRHPLSSRLFPAGRLDFEATGLLLLTNDGDLVHRLTHARFGVEKTYQMVVRGTIDDAELARIQNALARILRQLAARAEDETRGRTSGRPARTSTSRKASPRNMGVPTLSVIAREPGRTVLEMTAKEARAGEVREALAALGHPVKSMERVGIGPLRLRGVAVGHWRELERNELIDLRRAAAGKPPRRTGAAPDENRPKIAKRFRGIGRRVEAGNGTPIRTGRGSPGDGDGHPLKGGGQGDARRGRGESVNAKRRKVRKRPPADRPAGRSDAGSSGHQSGSRPPGVAKAGSVRAGKGRGPRSAGGKAPRGPRSGPTGSRRGSEKRR